MHKERAHRLIEAHHVAHGAHCACGVVRGVLLDGAAQPQVSKLGAVAAQAAAAAGDEHVARILQKA